MSVSPCSRWVPHAHSLYDDHWRAPRESPPPLLPHDSLLSHFSCGSECLRNPGKPTLPFSMIVVWKSFGGFGARCSSSRRRRSIGTNQFIPTTVITLKSG